MRQHCSPSPRGCLGCAEPFWELWQCLPGDSGTSGHKSCRSGSDVGLVTNKWMSLNLLGVCGEDGIPKAEGPVCA